MLRDSAAWQGRRVSGVVIGGGGANSLSSALNTEREGRKIKIAATTGVGTVSDKT